MDTSFPKYWGLLDYFLALILTLHENWGKWRKKKGCWIEKFYLNNIDIIIEGLWVTQFIFNFHFYLMRKFRHQWEGGSKIEKLHTYNMNINFWS